MSGAEVVERVKELAPTIRDRAREAEALRRLPLETVKELKDIGIVRLLQPARYGGLEADPRYFYEACLAIGAACGSTGWVAGVVGVHPWQLALFPDQVQAEIWGDDPDTWVSSTYMPGGVLARTPGGFTLNGRWSFSSGCDHCGWVILGCVELKGEGEMPRMWNVVIPRSDYEIDDVWDTVGLRGTGSNDIVVKDLFVPDHRTLDLEAMFSWKSPGLEVNTGPLYKMPFAAMFANAITVAVIAMGEGMVAETIEYSKKRVSATWGKAIEDPYVLAAVGEAASDVAASRAQLLANIGEMYETVCAGKELSMDLRTRTRRDQVAGAQRTIAAIDACYDRAGAGAISMASPLQRLWKDAHTGRHHTIHSIEKSFAGWTLGAMGLPNTDRML